MRARLGRPRGRAGSGLRDSRRPARRHLRRARGAAGRESLPEAVRLLLGGGGGLPARRGDRVSRPVLARRAAPRRDGPRPRRGQRRLDLRRVAGGAGGSPRARDVVVGREDRACPRARRGGGSQLRHDAGLGGGRGGARAGRPGLRLGRLDLAAVARCGARRRSGRRLRRHGWDGGDAAGAAVLLQAAVAPRHAARQPPRLRAAAAVARGGGVETGARLGAAAGGGGGGADEARGGPSISASSCSRFPD